LAKLQALLTDRFVGHDCTANEQQFCHVTMAEAEVDIQPARLMLSPGNRTPPKLHKLIDTLLTPDKNVQA
jgi:hypothetical protein